jgi:capsular polysaccharide biosynthesis protein
MDLMQSFGVLRRRWILASALLLLTLLGTAAAAVKLPTTYQAVGTTVLINSKNASATTDDNPLLAFSSSLASTAEVVSLAVMSPHTARALQAGGYIGGYQVAVSSVTGGPILQITVTGKNKSAVEHTLSGVMNEITTQLSDLQSGVTPRNRITVLPLSEGQPSHSFSKRAKPLVALLGLGLVVTFAVPQIVDALVGRRRARKQSAVPPQRVDSPGYQAGAGYKSDVYQNDSVLNRPRVRGNPRTIRSRPDRDQARVTKGR